MQRFTMSPVPSVRTGLRAGAHTSLVPAWDGHGRGDISISGVVGTGIAPRGTGAETPHAATPHRSPLCRPWTDRLKYTQTQGSRFPQKTTTRTKRDKDFWQVPWENGTPSPPPAWPC